MEKLICSKSQEERREKWRRNIKENHGKKSSFFFLRKYQKETPSRLLKSGCVTVKQKRGGWV